jgi:hypothetical protein
MDALLQDVCGSDTETILRHYLPVHDGMSERVNARVSICRDTHEYGGSPADEEMLTCRGHIVVDGTPHRFIWSVLYRGDISTHSFLRVTDARAPTPGAVAAAAAMPFPWTRRCNG